jgi:hypothetical protein
VWQPASAEGGVVEGEEDGEGGKVAGVHAHRLAGGGIPATA